MSTNPENTINIGYTEADLQKRITGFVLSYASKGYALVVPTHAHTGRYEMVKDEHTIRITLTEDPDLIVTHLYNGHATIVVHETYKLQDNVYVRTLTPNRFITSGNLFDGRKLIPASRILHTDSSVHCAAYAHTETPLGTDVR